MTTYQDKAKECLGPEVMGHVGGVFHDQKVAVLGFARFLNSLEKQGKPSVCEHSLGTLYGAKLVLKTDDEKVIENATKFLEKLAPKMPTEFPLQEIPDDGWACHPTSLFEKLNEVIRYLRSRHDK